MDKQKVKDLEEAIEIGMKISSLKSTIDIQHSQLISGTWDNITKRGLAEKVLPLLKHAVQELMDKINKDYSGIKIVEDSKTYIQKQMAELEKTAQKYLE